ncbi:MAG: hypothetical protein ABJH96_00455, partial [Algoriphagus sp.]|uniref:hypothetical protein n=1 Tax=Algoriphagus sp. TaxID=1872435 RepID=UPI0032980CB7
CATSQRLLSELSFNYYSRPIFAMVKNGANKFLPLLDFTHFDVVLKVFFCLKVLVYWFVDLSSFK